MASKRILLECRLARERERLGSPSFAAYLDFIESGVDEQEQARFVDLVTTHYTYFMRESGQFAFLETDAFPQMLQRKPERTWNILCAGCSTGEECYTLSMVVEDFARLNRIPNVRIMGIDLSSPAIEEARTATYPESRISKVPARWRTSYFSHNDDRFTVIPSIRKRVRFEQANFVDEHALIREYDLVLCRNAIIYLNHDAKQRAIDNLHRHLADGGHLVLGHAEIVRDHHLFAYLGDSIYQKQTEAASS